MTTCLLTKTAKGYTCSECSQPTMKGPYIRRCGKPNKPADAAEWFTAYYAAQKLTSPPLAEILAKLERCRSADCDLLQDDVCTMLGSNACKQRSNWFRMLAGGAVCQNWRPQQLPPD